MKNTTNTKNTKNTKNDDIKIIGKKFVFVINNDENNEKTEKAVLALIEWLKTSINNKKYTDSYGIVPGGWCINLSDVVDMYHICTTYDSITGGMVDVLYITFENKLLNRIVYFDNAILQRGSILLPIDGKIEYVPFTFKYVNGTRKRTTKTTPTTTKTDTKKSTTQKSTPTKTENKTSKTTQKTTQKTTAEKVNR